ncbi:hypothetical protein DPMN_012560 [Dreissena polymorpha]|uniref:Uncharacterized protein n=1 Tax=Dreissena polymorpha TaxID=45954 RepID=A0A9D4S118_DREPO|nr:hypothetical protein DPMN_012560 [Dreissena polymorpha]
MQDTGDTPFQSTLHLGLTSHAKDEDRTSDLWIVKPVFRTDTQTDRQTDKRTDTRIKVNNCLCQAIAQINILNKFHQDWVVNVASKVISGGHIVFALSIRFIKMYNVASRLIIFIPEWVSWVGVVKDTGSHTDLALKSGDTRLAGTGMGQLDV